MRAGAEPIAVRRKRQGGDLIRFRNTLLLGLLAGCFFIALPEGELKLWIAVAIFCTACVCTLLGLVRTKELADKSFHVSRLLYAGSFCFAIALVLFLGILVQF